MGDGRSGRAPAAVTHGGLPGEVKQIEAFGGQLFDAGSGQGSKAGGSLLAGLELLAQPGEARGAERFEHQVTYDIHVIMAGLGGAEVLRPLGG